MSARKLEELCIQQHFLDAHNKENKPYPVMDLSTMDPFAHSANKNKNEVLLSLKVGKTQQNIKSFSLPIVLQKLSGADLFRPISVDSLKPDEPPPLNIRCLPGTKRRPLRPWQSMKSKDQIIELSLACSLDSIWELAMEDGIVVPDPEDCLLSPDQFPLRVQQWNLFREWYAGEEGTNKAPGDGVPTLARVIFTEQYEMKHVEEDSYVIQLMKDMKFPLPLRYIPTPTITSVTMTDDPQIASQLVVYNKSKIAMFATVTQAYEKAINSSAGTYIRQQLISKGLNKLFQSRQMNFLKYFWTPSVGLSRLGVHYLFPHIGSMLYPRFSLPLKRYHLFPSRSKSTYNSEEILAWYNEKEIDSDDVICRKAEARGNKMREYHEWLAKEPERLVYSRFMMALEDSIAHQHREIDNILHSRFQFQEKRMKQLDEDLDTGDYDPKARTADMSVMSITGNSLMQDYQQFLDNTAAVAAATEAIGEEEYDEAMQAIENESNNGPSSPINSVGSFEPAIEGPVPLVPLSSSHPITPRNHYTTTEEEKPFFDDEQHDMLHSAMMMLPDSVREAMSSHGSPRSRALSRRSTDRIMKILSHDDGGEEDEMNEELNATLMEKRFRVLDALPQEYWYIFEESFEFKYGSGINNDDEAEEMQLIQQERMRRAHQDALDFEKSLNDQKKRREMEEYLRLKREEQERLYREGMARRRAIRENLEQLKRQRIVRADEEAAEKERLAEEMRIAEEIRKEQEDIIAYVQEIERKRLEELQFMGEEDMHLQDLKVRKREIRHMEHEDIMSYLVEQIQLKLQLERELKLAELQQIYEPFVPYQFKESRVRLPFLQMVLQDHVYPTVEDDFAEYDEDYLTLGTTRPFSESSMNSKTMFSLPEDNEIESEIRSSLPTSMMHTNQSTTGSLRSNIHSTENHSATSNLSPKRKLSQLEYHSNRTLQEHETASFASSKSSRNQDLTDMKLQDQLRAERAAQFEDVLSSRGKSRQNARPHSTDNDLHSMGSLSNPSQHQTIMDIDGNILASHSFSASTTSSKISSPRKEDNLVLRSRFHTPTKKTIRQLKDITHPAVESAPSSSPSKNATFGATLSPMKLTDVDGLLPFNPYGYDWQLLQSPSLLPSTALFSRPSSLGMNYHTGEKADLPRAFTRTTQHAIATHSLPNSRTASPDPIISHRMMTGEEHYSKTQPLPVRPKFIEHPLLEPSEIIHQFSESSDSLFQPTQMLSSDPHQQQLDGERLLMSTTSTQFGDLLQQVPTTSSILHPPAPENHILSHHSKKRKKLKELLSLSSALLPKNPDEQPKEWVDYLTTQKKLALSSLSSLDPIHRLPRKFVDLEALPKANMTTGGIQESPQGKRALSQSQLPTTKTSSSNLVYASPLDYKTYKMAKSASDTVLRLQQQRETLQKYVSGRAIYEDGYYLQACEPGIKTNTIIESNTEAVKFAQKLHQKLQDEDHNAMSNHTRNHVGAPPPNHKKRVATPPASKVSITLNTTSTTTFSSSGKSLQQDSLLSPSKLILKSIATEPPPVLQTIINASPVVMIPKVPIKKAKVNPKKQLKPLVPTVLNPFGVEDVEPSGTHQSQQGPYLMEDSVGSLASNELSHEDLNNI